MPNAAKGRTTIADLAEKIAQAHTDLCLFAAVKHLLEGGDISAASHADQFRLVAMADMAQDRAFSRLEKIRAAITKAEDGR